MNIAFSKIIKLQERLWEFNFRKLPADYLSFYGDVTDERGTRIAFSIYQAASGAWHLTGQRLPLWISAAESLIGQAIEAEKKALTTTAKA